MIQLSLQKSESLFYQFIHALFIICQSEKKSKGKKEA